MTDQLNIISDNVDIWLLGYKMEFSCLYIHSTRVLLHINFVSMKYIQI